MKKSLLKLALGIVAMSVGTASYAQTYTFTNCGAIEYNGPTQAQVNTAYASTNLNGMVTINNQGVQEWTVPASGTYRIQAIGATAGNQLETTVSVGHPANMTGDFALTAGQVLKIIVGQHGFAGSLRPGWGGGGGSFVATSTNTPLIVAGGCGSGHTSNTNQGLANQNASLTQAGKNGSGGTGTWPNGNGGPTGTNGCAGAGFYTDGNIGNGNINNPYLPGAHTVPQAFVNNGAADFYGGGFGGGGGVTNTWGGGGGGYSGGQGANSSPYFGGGGGSFNSGTNQVNILHTNNEFTMSHGQVVITNLCSPTIAPTITCPANITVNNDAGQCDAVVTYTGPTATDDCGAVATTLTAGLASGSTFPVGTTTNTFTATNSQGTLTCSFTVTVVDAEAPAITCPANITVSNDSAMCDAVVTYTAPVGTDNCAGATTALTSGPASGSTFPIGTTTITYTVTDAASNVDSCSFTVTVVDTTAPTITCGGNVASCDTVVSGIAPTGTSDNCTGEYVTYALSGATTGTGANDASGSTFNVGTTTIWYHVTDSAGNQDSCSFDVVVHPLPTIVLNAFNVDTMCLNDNPQGLPNAAPSGGTYSGPGVSGSTFDPSTAGVGTHYVTYSYTDANSCTNSDSTMIVVESCVGINENASLAGVRIYPNPTNGLININLGDHNGAVNYSISTVEGRLVTQEKNVATNQMTIDLNNESKGIYLLRIEDATSSKVYKIIKE